MLCGGAGPIAWPNEHADARRAGDVQCPWRRRLHVSKHTRSLTHHATAHTKHVHGNSLCATSLWRSAPDGFLVYKGGFTDGEMHGKGTYFNRDGTSWTGFVHQGLMSGYGVSAYPGKPSRPSIYSMGRRLCFADGEFMGAARRGARAAAVLPFACDWRFASAAAAPRPHLLPCVQLWCQVNCHVDAGRAQNWSPACACG